MSQLARVLYTHTKMSDLGFHEQSPSQGHPKTVDGTTMNVTTIYDKRLGQKIKVLPVATPVIK